MLAHRTDGDGFGDVWQIGLIPVEVLPELGRGYREVKLQLGTLCGGTNSHRGEPHTGE